MLFTVLVIAAVFLAFELAGFETDNDMVKMHTREALSNMRNTSKTHIA